VREGERAKRSTALCSRSPPVVSFRACCTSRLFFASSSVLSDGAFTTLPRPHHLVDADRRVFNFYGRSAFWYCSQAPFPFSPSPFPLSLPATALVPNMGLSPSKPPARSLTHDLSVAAYLASFNGRQLLCRPCCLHN
jgi:hypothetical protein